MKVFDNKWEIVEKKHSLKRKNIITKKY